MSRWRIVCLVLLLAAAIPTLAAASIQNYHWMANIQAGGERSGDQHNHYYNDMIVNDQSFLTNIHEQTVCCGAKWSVNCIVVAGSATRARGTRFRTAKTVDLSATS